jgi:hypothetical protein
LPADRTANRSLICKEAEHFLTNHKREHGMRTKTPSPIFDKVVASDYPAVYRFASRFTDNPREAIALAREAFNGTHKHLLRLRDQNAIARALLSAVIRAGLAAT